MRSVRVTIFSLTLVLASTGVALSQESAKRRYVVVFNDRVEPRTASQAHATRYGAEVHHTYRSALRGYAATIPENRVDEIRSDPSVRFVAVDRVAKVAVQTMPTGVSRSRALTTANTGLGVEVAILDTGIDLDHPDLAANIVGGVDCSGPNTGQFNDGHGHGSHVAGILAAVDNTIGVRGVAPSAKLWSVKVLANGGAGSLSEVVCGVDFVDGKSPAKGGAIKIANMSLEIGTGSDALDDENCGLDADDPLHLAICQLVDDGVTVVSAAGNFGDDVQYVLPAAYDEVITVSALADRDGRPCGLGGNTSDGPDDTFPSFSDFATLESDEAHMMAGPGVDILSTNHVGGYASSSGTSMAAPHVAGVAALYLQSFPNASPEAVLSALRSLGEPPDVNFRGECTSGVSHEDNTNDHPEPLVAAGAFPAPPIMKFTSGIVRGNIWYLNFGLDSAADLSLAFGRSTDRKVSGDWDGDGDFTPGIVRGNLWYLSNDLNATGEIIVNYGRSTDIPVPGDWNGDGIWTPGIVRGNLWFLTNDFDGTGEIIINYGKSTDRFVPGDWNGDGVYSPGIVRGNVWYVNNTFDGTADLAFAYGRSTDFPIAADWDGDGDSTPAIIRGNIWYVNNGLDGGADVEFAYGKSTDAKLAGDWNGLSS